MTYQELKDRLDSLFSTVEDMNAEVQKGDMEAHR